MGLWHLDLGEIEAAEAAFRASISVNPDDPGGVLGLARTLLQADRSAEALAVLEPMIADARRAVPYAYQLLGTALYRLGRTDEAQLAMARAATGEANWGDPTHGAVMQFGLGYGGRMLQARDLASRGDLRAAIIMLERLHDQRPDNALIANNLAAAYRALGDVDRSLALLEPVIAAHPDFYPARYTMAVVIQGLLPQIPEGEQEAMLDLALEHLRHALRVNPAYAQAAALEGDLLRALDRPDEAMDAYRQAAEQDPTNPVWSFQLAEMELAVGRDGEAIARLEALWRTWPQQVDIAVALAEAYMRAGDVAGADRIAGDLAGRFPADPRTSSLHARLASLRTGGGAGR
jgi:tetratricopeptide (TPR) repeat protein